VWVVVWETAVERDGFTSRAVTSCLTILDTRP
jgi:hypothetical protein